jgi:hypothetical protein
VIASSTRLIAQVVAAGLVLRVPEQHSDDAG